MKNEALEPCLEQMKNNQKFKFRQLDVPKAVISIVTIGLFTVAIFIFLPFFKNELQNESKMNRKMIIFTFNFQSFF